MSVIERTIQVSFRHQVHFTERVFAPANPLLQAVLAAGGGRGPHRVFVVLDEALARARPALAHDIEAYGAAFPDDVWLVAPPLVIEGGERTKNSYFHVSEVQSQLDRYHIDRHSYVLCVGGGALLDMVGLAAATTHRGVRHVRLPSTTLSQADSGVGVKNGINAFGKKNFIGTFAPPFAVINDFELLESLSPRDKRGGYVEAVKVALIRDRQFFEALEQDADKLRNFDADAMRRVICRCAELHVNHIATAGDPFELGSARPLDFGHWSAHKLEQLSEYKLRHGEAVAIGIALDVTYSVRMGLLAGDRSRRILRLLERLGFDLFSNELLHTDQAGELRVLHGLEEFREHLGGELTLTLLQDIGEGIEVHHVDPKEMIAALHELAARHAQPSGKPLADPLPSATPRNSGGRP